MSLYNGGQSIICTPEEDGQFQTLHKTPFRNEYVVDLGNLKDNRGKKYNK